MSSPPQVPYTAILNRYHEVIALPDGQRLKEAQQLLTDPEPLVRDFEASIAELAEHYRHQGTFHPKPRVPKPVDLSAPIERGWHVASHLHRQGGLDVAGAPDLDVAWVEYELSLLSTPGAAVFDKVPPGATPGSSPAAAGGAIKADLVMRDREDSTPVIGEVKVKRDKEPFSALIQLLAYIAHLATPSQYQRLRDQLPEGHFPDVDAPRFDGYLLLYRFGDSPSRYLDELGEMAELLAAVLIEQPAISRHIRRLVCLDLELDAGKLVGAVRWRAEAPNAEVRADAPAS